MALDPRLSAKLDQALESVRPHRIPNGPCCRAFVEDLRSRCAHPSAFAIQVAGDAHDVHPSDVRVSRTRIDVGPIRVALAGVVRAPREDPAEPTVYLFVAPDMGDEHGPRGLVFV